MKSVPNESDDLKVYFSMSKPAPPENRTVIKCILCESIFIIYYTSSPKVLKMLPSKSFVKSDFSTATSSNHYCWPVTSLELPNSLLIYRYEQPELLAAISNSKVKLYRDNRHLAYFPIALMFRDFLVSVHCHYMGNASVFVLCSRYRLHFLCVLMKCSLAHRVISLFVDNQPLSRLFQEMTISKGPSLDTLPRINELY